MNLIFCMLLVFALSIRWATENPDTGAGESSGTEGKSDNESIASLDDVSTEDDDDGADPARSDAAKTSGEGGDKTELILGKYKTNEELQAAYKELEAKMHEVSTENANLKKPTTDTKAEAETKEEWIELSDEQIASLQETDPEAHKWYLAEREARKLDERIDAKLKPINDKLAPVDELQKKELANQFFLQEETVQAQTKKMFGDEHDALDKQRQDVAFLQKLFTEIPKPLADAIISHNKNGSPEYARQLLLGQIQVYNMRQGNFKRSKSVNPDIGSPSGRPRQTDKASTLDEAGEMAAQELGIK